MSFERVSAWDGLAGGLHSARAKCRGVTFHVEMCYSCLWLIFVNVTESFKGSRLQAGVGENLGDAMIVVEHGGVSMLRKVGE
ncbi:MAG: hypothetical protein OET79_15735 [Nitrospirota bacterium]|nr:hypothetical protein [Nitrospirota bacterium]